ncbi:hypothetical protein K504DRAFT_463543 [Pleomassaria siparia CBS 279.74]|uniref:Cell wall mannoprotein PIR1-like C-terminal domain-containing protein n=1 Tax=Pleomassaria siparia CBS 279.74 TaxID=1314801 RepID=A0A6G1JSB0_9PLEO|nr:hypothetical protein K504DRAFT_463543 [Pleomassaria siparia CBS 279.74]
MRTTGILVALSLFATSSFAQGPPDGIAPDEPSPEGCKETVSGNFTLGTLVISSKHRRSPEIAATVTAEETTAGALQCSLKDGILKDSYLRTGSIVANYQFQFDGPPQAGALYTGGWSVCKNNSLAIGDSTTFYHCLSGGFANLYSENIGAQCQSINIVISLLNQPSSTSSSVVAPSTIVSSDFASATNTLSSNGTLSTNLPSIATSVSASATSSPSSPIAPPADGASATGSTGGAIPTRVPRRETFGAVIGILGAALIL